MKVEMQSGSSEFEDLDDANWFRRSSPFEPRKNIWNNQGRTVTNRVSSAFFSGKQSRPNDDDFEFVITKSRNAMKVKRPNIETNDNYRRFNNGAASGEHDNTRFSRSTETPFVKPRDDNRRNKVYKPVPHPGLQRNIDFNPFDSTSEESSGNTEPYKPRRYSEGDKYNEHPKRRNDRYSDSKDGLYSRPRGESFEEADFTRNTMVHSRYSRRYKYTPGCTVIFTKIKVFFKSVGFKIKRCITRSKTYISRMMQNRKQRTRARKFTQATHYTSGKARERLLANQDYVDEYTAGDEEPNGMSSNRSSRSSRSAQSPTVYRKKLDVPFNSRSNSTSSFEDLETKRSRKPKFPNFKPKDFKRSKFPDPKRFMQHVKLHSFPDGLTTNSNTVLSEHTHTDNDISTNGFIYSQTRGPKIVKPRDIIKKWKIRPGDTVVVISGKDKGKTGEVLMCDKFRNQVKVKGCNMRKLLVDSQVVQIEKKIHYSNVQLVDKLLNVGTRVTIKYTPDNKPLRVSKKSGYVIPWPEKKKREPREVVEGEKDTKPEEALRRTYDYHKDIISMSLLRQTMSKYNREIS
ncbi:hypothetical protein MACJ_001128 [Theileria orientalis]|uniref:Large ribosomal subunit protein uL24c n=1 Tax=Theileria orientalis TaxID=68886 RepID=A0A976QS75_THEOR|nr:hypothetical protein MACJ_001128 [Theileria orientalis]